MCGLHHAVRYHNIPWQSAGCYVRAPLKPLYIPIQFTAHTYLSWSTIGYYIKLKSELHSIAVICIWYSSSFYLYLYIYTVKYSYLTVLVKLLCSRKEYVFSETMIHTWILLFLYTYCLNYFSDTDSHSSREEDWIAECMQLRMPRVLAMGEHPSSFRFNQSAMREHMHRHFGVLFCHFWLVSWILVFLCWEVFTISSTKKG